MESNLERLQQTFRNMADDGFDTSKPLKWGFYFFDKAKNKLLNVYKELEGHGYKQEDLKKMDDGIWRLFVSKIDVLTPEKLHKRNIAFNELAEHFDVELYDGWDVEKN